MLKPSFYLLGAIAFPLLLLSCGSAPNGAVLMGDTNTMVQEGAKVYQMAQAAERNGKIKNAIKLYDQTATEYPFATAAADARYRQARLLDQQGEVQDAFDAYDQLLKSFPSSPNYTAALQRQSEIAQAAARGEVKTSILGIKGNVSTDKAVQYLTSVRDNAPKSSMAARAQFEIGELYHRKKQYDKAVVAFRKLVSDQPNHMLAPEALFQVGKILLENAERGNQNQATLDLSREAFNDYLLQYPGHKRNKEARDMISTLKGRELQRSFDIAEYYVKTGQDESAKVYYRDIIKSTKSGDKLNKASKARLKELGE